MYIYQILNLGSWNGIDSAGNYHMLLAGEERAFSLNVFLKE